MLNRLKTWQFWVMLIGGALALAPQIFEALGWDAPRVAQGLKWVGLAKLAFGLLQSDPMFSKEAGQKLLLALIVASLFLSAAQPCFAAPAASSTTAVSKMHVSVYGQVASIHLDGSLGAGPAICLGWSLSPELHPVVCASAEVTANSSGVSGHVGPQVGILIPVFVSELGLKVPPCVTFGWGFLKIGPGNFFDSSKGAFTISGSFPFLGL